MQVIETNIQDVLLIRPKVFGDERGYFFESYTQKWFDQRIGRISFVQDNESYSSYGVIRGLHFQRAPYSQSKLVRVVKGAVLDVVVDIRRGSPTFGQHVSIELTAENKYQLFIPRGFAHGFAVLSENALFQYKCDNYYMPQSEDAIAFDDPELGIDWKIPADKRILSEKDRCHLPLNEVEVFDYHISLYE